MNGYKVIRTGIIGIGCLFKWGFILIIFAYIVDIDTAVFKNLSDSAGQPQCIVFFFTAFINGAGVAAALSGGNCDPYLINKTNKTVILFITFPIVAYIDTKITNGDRNERRVCTHT